MRDFVALVAVASVVVVEAVGIVVVHSAGTVVVAAEAADIVVPGNSGASKMRKAEAHYLALASKFDVVVAAIAVEYLDELDSTAGDFPDSFYKKSSRRSAVNSILLKAN